MKHIVKMDHFPNFRGDPFKLFELPPPSNYMVRVSTLRSFFWASNICARVDQLLVLGMGDLQPLMTGILISWVYKPLQNWVDEFIPYYMEIMGVDRPDRTYIPRRFLPEIGGKLVEKVTKIQQKHHEKISEILTRWARSPVINGVITTQNGHVNG